MAYPSGNFSNPFAGPLDVVYSGDYRKTGGGAPTWGQSAWDIIIVCRILSGSTVLASGLLSRRGANPLALRVDYPGGNQVFTFDMSFQEAVFPSSGGVIANIIAENLRIQAKLTKR